jgi:hypothetical protein
MKNKNSTDDRIKDVFLREVFFRPIDIGTFTLIEGEGGPTSRELESA